MTRNNERREMVVKETFDGGYTTNWKVKVTIEAKHGGFTRAKEVRKAVNEVLK